MVAALSRISHWCRSCSRDQREGASSCIFSLNYISKALYSEISNFKQQELLPGKQYWYHKKSLQNEAKQDLEAILRHQPSRCILKTSCSIEPGYLPGLATLSFLRIKQPEIKFTFIRFCCCFKSMLVAASAEALSSKLLLMHYRQIFLVSCHWQWWLWRWSSLQN